MFSDVAMEIPKIYFENELDRIKEENNILAQKTNSYTNPFNTDRERKYPTKHWDYPDVNCPKFL